MDDRPKAGDEGTGPSSDRTESSRPARLLRSRTDRVLSGVSGGLGEYFGIDPVLVRIGWVVLAIVTGGTAILVYLVAWLIVPEEPRDTEARADRLARRQPAGGGAGARLVLGGVLIVLGAFMLFRLLVPGFFELKVLGPLLLVGVGVAVIAQAMQR